MLLPISSDLKRKQWMREGLIQAASTSFWSAYSGKSRKSVVYQVNNESASSGHTVVFDYDGNLSGRAIKGKNTAFGKGEVKRKFSDKVTVDRYRLVVDNGDEFDAVDIGDLSLSQHSDSRTKLADLFVRFKDQAIFDAAQGHTNNQAPTHTIDLGTTFDYNALVTIEKTIKTSQGYTTGDKRRPLDHFTLSNGIKCWILVIDTAMATKLKLSAGYQNIMSSADARGAENRLIKGYLGKIGSLIIVEADLFFGITENVSGSGATADWGLDSSDIEISGLRQMDANDKWTGEVGFDPSTALHSRGLVLGSSAIQLAFGKQPDYKHQESPDFAIKSESAVEFWMNANKCKLVAENGDYADAKLGGLDFGVVAIDVQI